jgi:hypothetical protein
MFIRRAFLVVGCLGLISALAPSAASAHTVRKHRPPKPVLRRIEVQTHYTEPTPSVGGFECRGLAPVPPEPECLVHFVGTSTFTGTMYGNVHYENWGMWQPNGQLTYEGPDYIDGGVVGCGTGTFIIDDTEGHLDYTKYDPATNSVPGYNKWHLRRGSGTGELVNLVDGEGVNNWREYFDGDTGQSTREGEGDFTGWLSCYR